MLFALIPEHTPTKARIDYASRNDFPLALTALDGCRINAVVSVWSYYASCLKCHKDTPLDRLRGHRG